MMGNETLQIVSLDPMTVKDYQRASPIDDLEYFSLSKDLSKVVKIRSQLPDSINKQFINFLKEYHDVFT